MNRQIQALLAKKDKTLLEAVVSQLLKNQPNVDVAAAAEMLKEFDNKLYTVIDAANSQQDEYFTKMQQAFDAHQFALENLSIANSDEIKDLAMPLKSHHFAQSGQEIEELVSLSEIKAYKKELEASLVLFNQPLGHTDNISPGTRSAVLKLTELKIALVKAEQVYIFAQQQPLAKKLGPHLKKSKVIKSMHKPVVALIEDHYLASFVSDEKTPFLCNAFNCFIQSNAQQLGDEVSSDLTARPKPTSPRTEARSYDSLEALVNAINTTFFKPPAGSGATKPRGLSEGENDLNAMQP